MSDSSVGLDNSDGGDFAHRRVLEALADAIVVADKATGTIVYANQAVSDLLGWEPFELVGTAVEQLVPPRLREAHHAGFERFADTGERRLMGRTTQMPAMRRDGMEVEVELTLSEALGTGLIVASFRDVTERVELVRQLAFVEQLQDTTALASRLSATTDVAGIASVVASSLIKSYDASGAEVWLADADGSTLVLTGTAGIAREEGTVLDIDERSLVAQAALSRHPVILNLVPEEGVAETAEARMYGFDAQAVLPLLAGDKLRGVLRATFRQRLTLDQTELLTTMSALVSSAMETALLMTLEQKARAEAEANQRRLGFLSEASAALAGSLDEASVLRTISRIAVGQLADVCVLFLVRADGEPEVAAIAGDVEEREHAAREIGRRFPAHEFCPPLRSVLITKRSEMFTDIPQEALEASAVDAEHLQLLRTMGVRSGLVVPLQMGGHAIGALSLLA